MLTLPSAAPLLWKKYSCKTMYIWASGGTACNFLNKHTYYRNHFKFLSLSKIETVTRVISLWWLTIKVEPIFIVTQTINGEVEKKRLQDCLKRKYILDKLLLFLRVELKGNLLHQSWSSCYVQRCEWSNTVVLETGWLTPSQNSLDDKIGWFLLSAL